MQVSDPLRAASLAALSRCAEPRGATRSAPAGCGTSELLQTSPNSVLSVPSTPLPLLTSAMPLPRTHFSPLLGPGFFLVGWEFSHYPRLLPQFALSSFADLFSLVSPANSLFLFVSPSLGTGSSRLGAFSQASPLRPLNLPASWKHWRTGGRGKEGRASARAAGLLGSGWLSSRGSLSLPCCFGGGEGLDWRIPRSSPSGDFFFFPLLRPLVACCPLCNFWFVCAFAGKDKVNRVSIPPPRVFWPSLGL